MAAFVSLFLIVFSLIAPLYAGFWRRERLTMIGIPTMPSAADWREDVDVKGAGF